ncbi:hypothetical protein ABE29_12420 [Cytobacillus firmus]|uniref:hypothetical protein n=2 Tax=Cytobacillus firmus TaxID=1399 RepID=UPI000E1380EA|nr:hypothetical protein [Cytobacillus firmus]MBG9543566.1 hypothetical protein [Cytobacillus firmus]MBG9554814.1 hypothetical protein [Cytobacillus firmus]MBG9555768.1 hypothetical protein [Cytobacillus firmus]MBG9574714.1 hypothetical protein [Cytobacillus firmus]MEC1891362.1 hypothetical protein [Cytobacillus firmus]
MVTFAFALASLVFIIPAVYFIPSGLTKKGKMYVIVVSVLLGMLGLTAKELFSEWQAALILLLLLMTGTYLANNKIKGLFHAGEETGAFSSVILETGIGNENLNEKNAADQEADKPALPILVQQESEEDRAELDLIDFSSEENTNSQIDLVIENIMTDPSEEKSDQDDLNWDEIENMLLEGANEDNAPKIDEKDTVENTLDPAIPEIDYLAELEGMMNEEMGSSVHSDMEINGTEDLAIQDEIKLSDNVLEEYFESLNPMDDSDDASAFNPAGENEIASEDSSEYDSSVYIDEAASAAETEIGIDDEHEQETALEKKMEAADQESRAVFQSQMFQLIAPQLELARNSLDKDSYEMLVIGCMNPNMQPSDYYTFARLLFDHYIIHKEFDKLLEFAESLEARFSAYPVLVEEIRFIQKSYAAAAKRKNYK